MHETFMNKIPSHGDPMIIKNHPPLLPGVISFQIGVSKTGIVGFVFQTSCLLLCVASVFAPGTCFGPIASTQPHTTETVLIGGPPATAAPPNLPKAPLVHNSLAASGHDSQQEGKEDPGEGDERSSTRKEDQNFTSVALFLTGIIASRFGE